MFVSCIENEFVNERPGDTSISNGGADIPIMYERYYFNIFNFAHSAPFNNELVTCDIRPDIDCHEVIEDWIMSNVSNVISSDIVQTLVPCLRRPGTSI